MNFSQKFISQVKDMHNEATTRFIMNGLTSPISVTFSIRQGDPAAMLLYVINMEPFLLYLNRACTGIRMSSFNQVDEDYADDVELLVDTEQDILEADRAFKVFEKCSGALLSRTSKSKVMGLGSWQGRQNWPLPWLQTRSELKVFGITICPNYESTLHRNWKILIASFRETVLSYRMRALDTLQQRAQILKIFACSRLWYKCQLLPLPSLYANQIESIMSKFLWQGKLERLSLQETFNPLIEGGLGLTDVRTKADALFVKQACRILYSGSHSALHVKYWFGPWKVFAGLQTRTSQ